MRVMKFGGASVATSSNFSKIADIILESGDEKIIVVISAMGNTTDQLVNLAKQVHPNPPTRELDMLISTGERVSIALLAMALALKGKEAISFTGSQSGIITCSNHTEAKIVDVRPKRLTAALNQKKVAIVAGFQGVSIEGEITTLGRGGSDTTAVALAAAMGAESVEFFKDVPGIFTTDPKKDTKAVLHEELTYIEAIDLARKGAKVLHCRSIELAQKNGIKLRVLPFEVPVFKGISQGTLVGKGAVRGEKIEYEGGF